MATCHSLDTTLTTATVEVFADVRCPFTHVGLRRLVEGRTAAGRFDVRLWVRAWPLELVNGEPLDPALIYDEVDELRRQVAPDLFRGFRPDSFPTTSLPALGLAASAYQLNADLGERVSLALRCALFEAGRDISDPAVLADVAARAGAPSGLAIDAAQVMSDWRDGQGRGVIGSPHFFVGRETYFCPSLDIRRDDAGHLSIAVDEKRLRRFMDRCFAISRTCGDGPE
jgi:predicted DsbA family dithiol-disulfide isomerase